MSSVEKIRKLFAKSGITVSSKVDDRIISDALTAFDKPEKTQSVSPEPNIWRIIMKSRITKLAAAATIIIAVFVGLYQLRGSIDVASVAWADVLEEMKNVRSVTFKVIDGPRLFTEVTLMKPGYERCVSSLDTHPISFRDHTRQRTLDIYPESKRAVVIQRVGWEASTIRLFNYFKWFEDMQNKTGECIDQEKIDGKIAQKFFVRKGGHEITFWVDPETNLPVKVKFGSGRGGRVMKDFVWNPELDESIFIFDPPDGYTVREIEEEIPTGPRPRRDPNSNNEIEGEIPYPYGPRPRTDGLRPTREPNSPNEIEGEIPYGSRPRREPNSPPMLN